MTESETPFQGRRLDARFTLLEKLGSGGQGEVWRAHDETRGIDIALKVPTSAAQGAGAVAAFEREHAIAARLNHPAVLKVFPPHRSGDVVLLPMELATGGDLRRLRGAGYLDIIPVLLDIAQALEHAHERGVIHRDLKPGNVLFDARGGVKLADFGAAGTTSTSAEDARLQGLSPFTASPEQLRGEAPTESDDIYGLGALAYELLSGYPPYYPHFDLHRAQAEPVPDLVPTRQIPPLLRSLVMRMLAKDKRERPHSMREVIDDLDASLNDTLTFDFESLVDPAQGAPSAAATVSGSQAESSRNATGPRAEAARSAALPDDEDAKDEDEYEQDEAPDLGLIPELLVANALVVTRKGSRNGSKPGGNPGDSPDGVPGAPKGAVDDANARQAADAAKKPGYAKSGQEKPGQGTPGQGKVGQPDGARAANLGMQGGTPQRAGSDHVAGGAAQAAVNARLAADAARGRELARAAAQSHNVGQAKAPQAAVIQATPAEVLGAVPAGSVPNGAAGAGQAVGVSQAVSVALHTESAQGAGATQGAGARRLADDHAVFNDTMQLPASARGLIDQGVNNDTVQLPPEPGAGLRERIAAVRGSSVRNDTELLSADELACDPEDDDEMASARAAFLRAPSEREPQERGSHDRQSRGQPAKPRAASPAVGARSTEASAPRVSTPSAGLGAGAARSRTTNAGTGSSASRASTTNAGAGGGGARSNTARADAPGTNTASLNALTAYASAPIGSGGGGVSANTASAGAPMRQVPAQPIHQPALAAAGLGAGGGGSNIAAERPLWESLQLETVPRVAKLEPIRRRRWPIVMLGILAGIAVAVFYWLPRYAPQGLPLDLSALSQHMGKSLAPATSTATSPPDEATAATETETTPGADNSGEAKLQATRENFDRRLAALDARDAGVWGGAEFAMAKQRAAESIGAHDAGNTQMAQDRLADASHLLDEVESRAPQAFAAELAAGQKALAAGQEEVANQAFDLARKIDPNDHRIADGQRRAHNLSGVLPLLADAQNAENARNYSRAAQDYSQVLALDPGNDKARTGLARANASFGDDNYAKAVGSGFAALGAGRLDDAREAFEKARALRPNGSEAAEGLRRVGGALSAKGYASVRQRAAGLEAQERWDEAVQLYDSALQSDPSLAFAQAGKDRAAARAELGASMQALIDRPERLSSPSVRSQAKALLDTANAQSPSGPVLRSEITRLGMLLPDYDSSAWRGTARTDLLEKPVRLSLVSDNATAISIPSIGQFGTFAKRDIELKPGRYTVIGTREGYRDVHRDITISPGQESQTISVSCADIL